jgi:Putative zinc-finger
MTCERAHLDGAYVLGSLSPGERLDFERHLPACDECSRSVQELAGLPGLLAQVDASDLAPASVPPLPPTLLPSLVREVRGSQRRRSVLVAAAAAAVAVVAAVGALAAGGVLGGDEAPTTASSSTASPTVTARAPARPMVAVAPTAVRADVAVTSVAWGTRLDLTCSYGAGEEEYEATPSAEYALVLRTRAGQEEQVATWRGLPGRTMRLSAATATSSGDIEAVELRTAEGLAVLRLGG